MLRDLKNLVYKGRKISDELGNLDNILLNNLSVIPCVQFCKP